MIKKNLRIVRNGGLRYVGFFINNDIVYLEEIVKKKIRIILI